MCTLISSAVRDVACVRVPWRCERCTMLGAVDLLYRCQNGGDTAAPKPATVRVCGRLVSGLIAVHMHTHTHTQRARCEVVNYFKLVLCCGCKVGMRVVSTSPLLRVFYFESSSTF